MSSRETAESVEDRRARANSLALSTVSGTLPLLPELVSSDRPESTWPNILKCFGPTLSRSDNCSASILGSWGGAELLEVTDLPLWPPR